MVFESRIAKIGMQKKFDFINIYYEYVAVVVLYLEVGESIKMLSLFKWP